ncbi:hypothetical protein VNO77_17032 [Canavalia gladiata]|uniref:BHLH domain-containing protein n=1 Tax=Canavalia gladiata TaxID=3824 RepID=A0AAN9LI72_CANGL
MVAFCSPGFSPPGMGWILEEELLRHNHNNFYYKDKDSYSFPHQFSSLPHPQVEIQNCIAPSPDSTMVKKLNHNASERDRRKKINCLVSSLRSLLPLQDQTKKMSIPVTISRVLKYIPELQQEVQRLAKKKEELLRRISQQGDAFNKESQRKKIPHHNSVFVVSTNRLNDSEASIHISSYDKLHKAPLSDILQCLQNNGLFLLNASSNQTFGDRVFYNLHIKVEKTRRLKSEITEKLFSVYEKKQRIF